MIDDDIVEGGRRITLDELTAFNPLSGIIYLSRQ